MTQVFEPDGTVVPATVIKAGPCVVVQAKTAQTDGYEAVQLGLVEETPAKVNKPLAGHYKKAGVPPTRVRREVKLAAGGEAPKAGDQVLVTIFADGDRVDVIGISRGKGFQGVMKRHHFARRRGDARLDVPPRARIDRRLVVPVARRQGHARGRPDGRRSRDDAQPEGREVDAENHLLVLRGAVPGAPGGYVIVRKAIARKPDPQPQVEKPKKGKK